MVPPNFSSLSMTKSAWQEWREGEREGEKERGGEREREVGGGGGKWRCILSCWVVETHHHQRELGRGHNEQKPRYHFLPLSVVRRKPASGAVSWFSQEPEHTLSPYLLQLLFHNLCTVQHVNFGVLRMKIVR